AGDHERRKHIICWAYIFTGDNAESPPKISTLLWHSISCGDQAKGELRVTPTNGLLYGRHQFPLSFAIYRQCWGRRLVITQISAERQPSARGDCSPAIGWV